MGHRFGPFDEAATRSRSRSCRFTALREGRPSHADFTIRSTDGRRARDRGERAFPILAAEGSQRRHRVLLAARGRRRIGAGDEGQDLGRARVGPGSPGPETIRYGGNTSCVAVTLSDGTLLALDAGTGIRSLGLALADEPARMNVLLTHLHLDHIQGLMFFAPAFRPQPRS